MATEVLRPQDVLVDRFPPVLRRQRVSNNGGFGNKAASKPDKKKVNFSLENAAARKKAKNGFVGKKEDGGAQNLQMGNVTLLRRGETLDSVASKVIKSPQPKPVETVSDPEILLKQIRLSLPPMSDMYAGSAFYSSPSPRSLPLPSFFNQKKHQEKPLADSATEDLRRLLRLE